MKDKELSLYLVGVSSFALIAGCSPGPPRPPLPLENIGAIGIGWLFLGFIAFGAIIIWKNSMDTTSMKSDNLASTLKEIYRQLEKLEEKIGKLEDKNKRT